MKPVIEFQCINGNAQPMYACGNCRTLGAVIDRNNDLLAAENCCLCKDCKINLKEKYRTVCSVCHELRRQEQERKRQEQLEALPELHYDGGFVYYNGSFYDDLDAALDDPEESALSTAIIHPCRESNASIPDLISYVDEYLFDQYDDPAGTHLSTDNKRVLSDAMKQLVPPKIWIVRDDVRLIRSWLTKKLEKLQ